MTDLSALGIKVTSSGVVKTTSELTSFTKAAKAAGAAASKTINMKFGGASMTKMINDLKRMDATLKAMGGGGRTKGVSVNFSVTGVNASIKQIDKFTKSIDNARAKAAGGISFGASGGGGGGGGRRGRPGADMDEHVKAFKRFQAAGTDAFKFTAQEGLNFSRQMADIGVTAAMGMNPFMIVVQQGPQLFDIFQQAGARSGQTIGATFKAAGVVVWTAIAPLIPIILAVSAAGAGLALVMGSITKQANSTPLRKYTEEMGYTRKEVKELNAMTVGMGDTLRAVFQVGMSRIADSLGINTKKIVEIWNRAMDAIINAARVSAATAWAVLTTPITTNFMDDYKKQYQSAMTFMDDVAKQAHKNAMDRQAERADELLGSAGGKSREADRLRRIMEDARGQIEEEKNRAAAIGMTAQAAAELAFQTDLTTKLNKAGIPVVGALKKEVSELASAYAHAKINADILAAVDSNIRASRERTAAIVDELQTIGIYGDELTRTAIRLNNMRAAIEALPEGAKLTGSQVNAINEQSEAEAAERILTDRIKREEQLAKTMRESQYSMQLEREGLMLTGEAAIANAYAMNLLNAEYERAGNVSEEFIRNANMHGEAFARQRHAIDEAREALEFNRDMIKGFSTDLLSNLRQGGDAFKAFADAAVSALDRVISRLMDQAFDNLFAGKNIFGSVSNLFGGGGGGARASALTIGNMYANGGTFGTPTQFAKGGTFTNSIVSSPTMFRFAKGGALGEMGEAGPEAIMPLKRGPDGSLGVSSHGGDSKLHVSVSVDGSGGLTAFVRNQAGEVVASASPAIADAGSRQAQSRIAHKNTRRLA